MSQDTLDVNQEVETLINEMSDEALEAAACSHAVRSYTIAMCTAQVECPF